MKKIIFFLLFALLICFVAGCGSAEDGRQSDETSAVGNDLTVIGAVEGKTTLNPTFSWKNNYNDKSFTVRVFGEELIDEIKTSENYASVTKYLLGNTAYKVTVTGDQSGRVEQLDFVTMDVTNQLKYIKADNPFSSNMVIQRDKEITLSGTGPSNSLITVIFGSERHYVNSDGDGAFSLVLPPKKASFDPIDIVITNGVDNKLTINNVLIGDVYLFAGQSNMQWPTMSSDYETDDVSKAIDSDVRFFCQDVVQSQTKLESVKNGRWFAINPNNYSQFSAIAFMSGSMLSDAMKADVPIGIVTAYQGNTNIANWMGPEYYTGSSNTKFLHYNSMIYPLRHTKLTGTVWYQGCNNSGAGGDYKDYLLALFRNYRDLFNSPDMPFFVIGLACYDGDAGNNYDFSYVREAQAKACEQDDDAYFISSCDDGDPTYIHPRAKRYICTRVSKSIQSVVYGKDYYATGPSYKSHVVENGKAIITLDNAEGLYSTYEISGMYLAGSDGKYYEADVSIKNGKLEAYAPEVPEPVYVKYGFGKSPFVNVFNKDGFAITPFRTDDYNNEIDLLEYNDIKAYTFHPDGSKMNISYKNGNLNVTKTADGKTYGSVRLEKWGMVAYNAQQFKFGVVGTNSGASISFRFIEGSYEIWAYKIVDDFVGLRETTIGVGDFKVVYNKLDGVFDTQKINYIEIMVESSGAASFEISQARFATIERTAPMAFSISNCAEDGTSVRVSASKSVFADNYTLKIYENTADEPVYTETRTDALFAVAKNVFTVGKPYYVYLTAENELGKTSASNDGYVFYLKTTEGVVVCNFDFTSQESLEAYMSSSMSVHSGLTVTLQDNGVKIDSDGKGWQQFIFKLETGLALGMNKLRFTADFSHYNGKVVLQLADTKWDNYTYNLDISSKISGTYTIDLSQFKLSGTAFTTQSLMWIMFNFDDSVGGGYILLDDVQLLE